MALPPTSRDRHDADRAVGGTRHERRRTADRDAERATSGTPIADQSIVFSLPSPGG